MVAAPMLAPGSPLTAVFLWAVAFLIKDTVGHGPLTECLHPSTTRELLDSEIDTLLDVRKKGPSSKHSTRAQIVAEKNLVIRKHTMKVVKATTVVQVKKLFQGYPHSWPQLTMGMHMELFRRQLAHDDHGTDKHGSYVMEVEVPGHVQADNTSRSPEIRLAFVEATRRWYVMSWPHLPTDTAHVHGDHVHEGYKSAYGAARRKRMSTQYQPLHAAKVLEGSL
jgi:hypothetical protein